MFYPCKYFFEFINFKALYKALISEKNDLIGMYILIYVLVLFKIVELKAHLLAN
jgi:hypothetical protein